jgi:hypothetical protein
MNNDDKRKLNGYIKLRNLAEQLSQNDTINSFDKLIAEISSKNLEPEFQQIVNENFSQLLD